MITSSKQRNAKIHKNNTDKNSDGGINTGSTVCRGIAAMMNDLLMLEAP